MVKWLNLILIFDSELVMEEWQHIDVFLTHQ